MAIVSGCSKPQPQPMVVQVQQPQVQYIELNVIEGKTTKAEILQALVTPDAFDKFHIRFTSLLRKFTV